MLIIADEDLPIASDIMEKIKCVQKIRSASGTASSYLMACNGKNCSACFQLPDDLLVEILCLLPDHKHLITLKCVCKSWNDLVTKFCIPKISALSPLCGFIYHKKKLKSKPFVDYIPYATPSAVVEPNQFVKSYCSLMPYEPAHRDFLDCCNGLLLFIDNSFVQFYVCNPTTKQCAVIPGDFALEKPGFAALAFNPSESPHYRIVCFDHSLCKPLRLKMFSSETNKWTSHDTPFGPISGGPTWIKRCFYFNGVLYRLCCSSGLCRFDLNETNARTIQLPEEIIDRADAGCIGISKGHLYYSNVVGSNLFVWLLEDRSKVDRWVLRYNIHLNSLEDHQHPLDHLVSYSNTTSKFKPYAFHPTSEIVFLGSPGIMLSYHLEEKRMELVCRMDDDKFILVGPLRVFPYVPCLVNLKDFCLRRWA